MATKYNPGEILRYKECPPNWRKMQELCFSTNEAIAQAKEGWKNNAATVRVVEAYEGEEEGEPESYQIEFLNNPELADIWQGCGYADLSELERVD